MPGLGLILASLTLLAGCRHPKPPGALDVPPGLPAPPGVYTDINPRWSHDGKRIAFLRATPDRRLQLALADAGLSHPRALLEAELVCPDRPYSPGLRRYASPDTLAWSPDDRRIAFARPEWFTFEDGERLPGTGLWALNLTTGRVTPLALHPKRYLSVFYYYHAPQWSPDGRYLAFAGEGINGQRVIFVRRKSAPVSITMPTATGRSGSHHAPIAMRPTARRSFSSGRACGARPLSRPPRRCVGCGRAATARSWANCGVLRRRSMVGFWRLPRRPIR